DCLVGALDEQRHTQDVGRVLARLEVSVVIPAPETRTVVGDNHDDRAFEFPDCAEMIEQFAEQSVDEFDLLQVPPLGFGNEVLVVGLVA
ncbi:MAG: hypothetical protein AAEJ52_17890, partial [Myxococcota bacterium]